LGEVGISTSLRKGARIRTGVYRLNQSYEHLIVRELCLCQSLVEEVALNGNVGVGHCEMEVVARREEGAELYGLGRPLRTRTAEQSATQDRSTCNPTQ
jgi:hypothetical protein